MRGAQGRPRLAVTAVTTGLLLVALVGCSDPGSSADQATAGSRAAVGASGPPPAQGGASPGTPGLATAGSDGPQSAESDRAGSDGAGLGEGPGTVPDGAGSRSGPPGSSAAATGVPGSVAAAPATPLATTAPGAAAGGGSSSSRGSSASGGAGSGGAGSGGAGSGSAGSGGAGSVGAGASTVPTPVPSAVFLGEACDPAHTTDPATAVNGLVLYCSPDDSSSVGGRWSTAPPSSAATRPAQGGDCDPRDVGRIVRGASGRPLICLRDPTGSLSWSDVS
ncbi:Collagen triple helix repeat protein [Frankia sp. AiPs1]|uniref:hypothetical protein n=1 Tax=Frankia sp. AiPa1 TaxID=573492 RepID=UPI00202B7659|nr:hypothetical protein [Frankia sp. AiPa1]MCL9760754.1 hypothetical protein [Frankia sp. AiPa1]